MGSVVLRRMALGLIVVLGVAAGCGAPAGESAAPTASPSSSASPSPTASAAVALAAATRKLNEQAVTANVTTTGTMTAKGQIDPVARVARMTISIVSARPAIGMQVIVVGGVTYAKIAGMRGVPAGWMRFESDTLAGTLLDVMPKDDPVGANRLVAGMVTVERDGDRGYRGTLDPSRSRSAGGGNTGNGNTGGAGKIVPFTATVDDQGRLTALTIELGAVVRGAGDIRATYLGFGQPVTVEPPPASEVVDAPADVVARLRKA